MTVKQRLKRLEELQQRIAADDRQNSVPIDPRVLVVLEDGETVQPDPSRLTLEGEAAEAVLRYIEEATGEHPATVG